MLLCMYWQQLPYYFPSDISFVAVNTARAGNVQYSRSQRAGSMHTCRALPNKMNSDTIIWPGSKGANLQKT